MSKVPPIAAVPTSVTAFIGWTETGPLHAPIALSSFGEYERQFGPSDANSPMGDAVDLFFANGGTSLYIVRSGADVGQLDDRNLQACLRALDSIPFLNLLCLPGITESSTLRRTCDYCEKRRAFLIIDVDRDATTFQQLQSLLAARAFPRDRSISAYAPWLQIPDTSIPSGLRTVAPSGAVAGIYALTDARRGVWKAPAGREATLIGVESLTANLSDADTQNLETLGLNVLRFFPQTGTVVWGARTSVSTSGSSDDYRYVPVRRLALFVEESVVKGLQWVVFEPNGTALWTQISSSVTDFLQQLFLQGAFPANKPDDAYFVRCDATTMTQSDIEQGVINVLVGIAPLRPAEFILLRIAIRSQA
jgi:phage tail sheath protein FI